MASKDNGRPLPTFGEWDVNNPASAEGFTVIFSKARDEKKGAAAAGNAPSQRNITHKSSKPQDSPDFPMKWRFCCF